MNIDDDGIAKSEEFVKKELSVRFQQTKSTDNLTDFFGAFYAKNPNDFVFHVGDKILIKQLAAHIKEILEKDGSFSRFQSKSKNKFKRIGVVKTSIGTYFGSNDMKVVDGEKKLNSELDEKSLHTLLYEKTMKLLQSGVHKDSASSFSESMVIVNTKESVAGYVVCVYCNKQKKVFFDNSYWVLSNLGKHLNSCFGKKKQSQTQGNSFENEQLKDSSVIFVDSYIDKTKVKSDEKSTAMSPTNQEADEIELVTEVVETDKFRGSLLSVSTLDDDENQIYFQICDQDGAMRGLSFENEEEQMVMPVMLEPDCQSSINVCAIEADGNCLVASLAHQLFHCKIDSEEHNDLTSKLRMESVAFARNNYKLFKKTVIYRDDFETYATGETIKDKFNSFLDVLAQPKFWCGTETIIAVSRLYKVNVIIINQGGNSYMIEPFHFDYNRCVLLAYCVFGCVEYAKPQSSFNHYNSVCKIDQNTIFMCMKKIISQIQITPTPSNTNPLQSTTSDEE